MLNFGLNFCPVFDSSVPCDIHSGSRKQSDMNTKQTCKAECYPVIWRCFPFFTRNRFMVCTVTAFFTVYGREQVHTPVMAAFCSVPLNWIQCYKQRIETNSYESKL